MGYSLLYAEKDSVIFPDLVENSFINIFEPFLPTLYIILITVNYRGKKLKLYFQVTVFVDIDIEKWQIRTPLFHHNR